MKLLSSSVRSLMNSGMRGGPTCLWYCEIAWQHQQNTSSLAETCYHLSTLGPTWYTLMQVISLLPLFSRDHILPSVLKFQKYVQVLLKQKKYVQVLLKQKKVESKYIELLDKCDKSKTKVVHPSHNSQHRCSCRVERSAYVLPQPAAALPSCITTPTPPQPASPGLCRPSLHFPGLCWPGLHHPGPHRARLGHLRRASAAAFQRSVYEDQFRMLHRQC